MLPAIAGSIDAITMGSQEFTMFLQRLARRRDMPQYQERYHRIHGLRKLAARPLQAPFIFWRPLKSSQRLAALLSMLAYWLLLLAYLLSLMFANYANNHTPLCILYALFLSWLPLSVVVVVLMAKCLDIMVSSDGPSYVV